MRLPDFRELNVSRQFMIMAMGMVATLLIGAVIYMTYFSLESKDEQLQMMADSHARSVVEKIDRNFYERFGDVQAFAANQLAVDALTDSGTTKLTHFMNTMVNYYVLYDFMMVCDMQGNVIAVNSKDKAGKKISSAHMIGKNFATQPWFKACSASTFFQGAWYSDFHEDNNVSRIYSRIAWGMAFAAPIIKDNKTIGVWYNFANWNDVTVGIRKETETILKSTEPGAFILLTNAAGQIIDSEDSTQLIKTLIPINNISSDMTFKMKDRTIIASEYLIGKYQGTGAYSYAGKNWVALTFIPRTKFSMSYILHDNSGFLIAIACVLLTSGFLFYWFTSTIARQLKILKGGIEKLSQGEFSKLDTVNVSLEINEMTTSVQKLITGLSRTAEFAGQVGAGNFTSEFNTLSQHDTLGNALLTMRTNLKEATEAERKRTWSIEGVAQIGVMLRNTDTDADQYYYSILSFVVKYTKCNQGSLFLPQDNNQQVLEMVACYAWEKRKFQEKLIEVGSGLVGQCFVEGQTVHLRDIPENYVHITSGLGGATPKTVLIVPLKINDEVFGILELASFERFEKFQIDLIEKLAENIASAIATQQVQSHTKKLLEQSQQQAEELRAQEEEMRQNMEELTATQEEMRRYSSEMESRIAAINESGIASVEFDLKGNILVANPAFLQLMGYTSEEIRGHHHRIFVTASEAASTEYKLFWDDLAAGIARPGEFKRIRKDGTEIYIHGSYSIIKSQDGKPLRVLKLATDITIQKKQLEKMELIKNTREKKQALSQVNASGFNV